MKLSFTTMATPELTVRQQAEAAKGFGFHAVDLRMQTGGSGEIPPDAEAERLEQIREDAGTVSSILCYNGQIDTGIEKMAESVRQHLEIARAIQAPAIRIFTGLPRVFVDFEFVRRQMQDVDAIIFKFFLLKW